MSNKSAAQVLREQKIESLLQDLDDRLFEISRLSSIAEGYWLNNCGTETVEIDGRKRVVWNSDWDTYRDMTFLFGKVFEKAKLLNDQYDSIWSDAVKKSLAAHFGWRESE